MVNDDDTGKLRNSPEPVVKLGSASIIYDNDRLNAKFQKIGDDCNKRVARLISRDKYWYFRIHNKLP